MARRSPRDAADARDAVRAARADLRPLRSRCSRSGRTRAGGASSSRASTPGPATACSTSRRAPARSRSSSRAERLLRRRRRPEPGDARGGATARRRGRARRPDPARRGRAEELPFEDALVRRAHVHLPAPLRRRPGGDAARARARRAARAGRSRRSSSASRAALARAPGSSTSGVGLPLAGRAISPGWHEVGRLPRAEHPRASTRATRSPRLARALARRRDRGRPLRRLSLGGGVVIWGRAWRRGPAGVLRARARRLARLRDAAPPAVHRCGTSPTSRSAPRSRPSFDDAGSVAALAAFSLAHGHRRARARRAARPAAADADPGPVRSSRSPRVSIAGAAAIGVVAALAWTPWLLAVRRLRRLPRLRVQPRALRRALPLGPLVRARLGRVPPPDGLSRRPRRGSASRRCSPPASRPPQPRPAAPLDPGAHGAAPRAERGRNRGVQGRNGRDDRRRNAQTRSRTGPAGDDRGSRSRWRLRWSCCGLPSVAFYDPGRWSSKLLSSSRSRAASCSPRRRSPWRLSSGWAKRTIRLDRRPRRVSRDRGLGRLRARSQPIARDRCRRPQRPVCSLVVGALALRRGLIARTGDRRAAGARARQSSTRSWRRSSASAPRSSSTRSLAPGPMPCRHSPTSSGVCRRSAAAWPARAKSVRGRSWSRRSRGSRRRSSSGSRPGAPTSTAPSRRSRPS